MFESKLFLSLVGGVLLLLLLWGWQWFRFYQLVQIGKTLAERAERFEHVFPEPPQTVLFVGDSTVVGTGTTNNMHSVAGRLGAFYPNVLIENRGVNGALIRDLAGQLSQASLDNYDVIVIQSGGNDVVYFSDLKKIDSVLATALQKALKKSDKVVMMSSGDVGKAPIWPVGVGRVFTQRTLHLRNTLQKTTAELGVEFVDLYGNGVNEAFVDEPALYHSPDQFHPSDSGYGLWFEALKDRLQKLGWL